MSNEIKIYLNIKTNNICNQIKKIHQQKRNYQAFYNYSIVSIMINIVKIFWQK